jgi:PIN domain nuclease of toxin-antitoxin system
VTVVIDTSALIALVQQERGADRVAANIDGAVVSTVIFAECLSKLAGRGLDPNALTAGFLAAGLRVEPVGPTDVPAVVALHQLARRDVSLADRFCLALALDRGLAVLTADRPWADLGLPLQIELIR